MSSYAAVPKELKALPNWVVWRLEHRNGKPTKIPYDPKTGSNALADDPSTWGTFKQAVEAADILTGNDYNGIGFEFGETPYEGVDFDGLLDANRAADPYALAILAAAGNPYCEVSPSKTGLHMIVEGSLPAGAKKKFFIRDHYGLEIYDTGRYFTITGDQFSGSDTPKVDSDLIYLLVSQVKDAKFKKLWLGDTSGQLGDDSSADFALMCRLAELTKCDAAKMEKFFGASALGQREKWQARRENYRLPTIKAAIESVLAGKPAANTAANTALEFRFPRVTSGTHRDWVFEPSPGMYEGLFPRGAISLIAATSGGGKTTLMIQALLAQRAKAPFLGRSASAGYSFAMLGADRGSQDHMRTMESMHLPLDAFRFERIPMNALDISAVQIVVNSIENQSPMPEIVFLEGLDMMVTNVNDMQIVSSFLGWMQQVAEYYHVSIIGSVGAPKSKEGQSYNITRENILGSGAWGRGSATVVTIQFPNGDDSEGRRIVKVLPRRAKPERLMMEFQDGLLVVVPDDPEEGKQPILGRPNTTEQKAIRFLERELQSGPRKGKELVEQAHNQENIARSILYNAADAIKVVRREHGRIWELSPMHEGHGGMDGMGGMETASL